MISPSSQAAVGVLLSGGLDSGILVGHLLSQGVGVQPFYIRSGLHWEAAELSAARKFLDAIACDALQQLVVLALPLQDLYQGHWSLTGRAVPDADSPDEAVYLPGRNALLIIKAALWCQLHGISRLALAPLGNNPFDDASCEFFDSLQTALNHMGQQPIEILRPFSDRSKHAVMQLGRDLPLALTFSCIAPRDGRHCGDCNKCAERQAAFRHAAIVDPTPYLHRSADESAA
ncbi:MAG: 7-cyano-7-deazaguanine synthase [Pirellulaceae bacterium]